MPAGQKNAARTDRVLNNFQSSVLAKLLTLFLHFFSRTVFIHSLGNTYLSVNGLYGSVLGILSLAEMGFAVTIVFSMYKPLAERDYGRLSSLLLLYRRVYLIIGTVILVVGLGLIPALDLLIDIPEDMALGSLVLSLAGRDVSIPYVTVYYVMYLVNTSISYFAFGYRRSVLTADQRSYVITNFSSALTIVKSLVQVAVLMTVGKHAPNTAYTIYMLIDTATVITSNVVVAVITRRMYPEVNIRGAAPLPRSEKTRIAKEVGSSAVSRIAHVALHSTDNILISAMIATLLVGSTENYTLVTGEVDGILCMFTGAMTASLGNYFAEKSRAEGLDLFRKITYANIWLYGLSAVALITLLNPFITVWLHSEEFLLSPAIVIALTINFFVAGYMSTLFTFRSTLGLFTQGWLRPVIVAAVNIGASIGLAKALEGVTWFGFRDWPLFGILIATFISRLSVNLWYDPIIIHKYGFGATSKPFFRQTLTTVGWSVLLCLLLLPVKLLLPVTLDMEPGRRLVNFILLTLITATVCAGGFWILNHKRPEYIFFKERIFGVFRLIGQKLSSVFRRKHRKK